MNYTEARELVNFIHRTFGKALLTTDKAEHYAAELYNVDPEAEGFIKNHFRALDICPVNIAKEIRRAHGLWQAKQPREAQTQDCSLCNGDGILHYLRYDDRLANVYEYCGRCPNCENWRGKAGIAIPEVSAKYLSIARPESTPFTNADYIAVIDAYQKSERMGNHGL